MNFLYIARRGLADRAMLKMVAAVAVAGAGVAAAVWSTWPTKRPEPPMAMGAGVGGPGGGPGGAVVGGNRKMMKGPAGPKLPGADQFTTAALKAVDSEADAELVREALEQKVAAGALGLKDLTDTPSKTSEDLSKALASAAIAPMRGSNDIVMAAVEGLGGQARNDKGEPMAGLVPLAAVLGGLSVDPDQAIVSKVDRNEPEAVKMAGGGGGGVAIRMNKMRDAEPGEPGGEGDPSAPEKSTTTVSIGTDGMFPEVAAWRKDGLPAVRVTMPAKMKDESIKEGARLSVIMARSRAGKWQPAGYDLEIDGGDAGRALMKRMQSGRKGG